ncbi:hypothetical protein [Piscinibacter koreensis]|uniref:Uncharacterized protein n=1 Tax=Piscinibacter koreensis TaxID=2742824 RepID=A0A7Y6TX53_9BURK|nr:hypothetical protein [Schlegelella koreensis]NUZ06737.1 hypothetical protein [Schlegelella koreensis]
MKNLDARLVLLEAPFVQTGPVLLAIDDPQTPEQDARIKEAEAAGLTVILVTALELSL